MDSKVLGANIRKARLDNDMTQEEVASVVGLSVNYYRQIELGNKVPQLKTFVNIANALQVSADTLLQGNLTYNILVETNTLADRIVALPPKKRALATTQIEAILNSLEEY